jgi:hypothetical protein
VSDRRADVYAVYSAVLLRPSLSHPDNRRKYLVSDHSGVSGESDLAPCTTVPAPCAPENAVPKTKVFGTLSLIVFHEQIAEALS